MAFQSRKPNGPQHSTLLFLLGPQDESNRQDGTVITDMKRNETKFMLFATFVVRGLNGHHTPILALFAKQSCATEVGCTRLLSRG